MLLLVLVLLMVLVLVSALQMGIAERYCRGKRKNRFADISRKSRFLNADVDIGIVFGVGVGVVVGVGVGVDVGIGVGIAIGNCR